MRSKAHRIVLYHFRKFGWLVIFIIAQNLLFASAEAFTNKYIDSIKQLHADDSSVVAEIAKKAELLRLQKKLDESALLYKYLGAHYQKLSVFDTAIFYYDKSFELATSNNNAALQSASLYNKSISLQALGNFQLALNVAKQAFLIDSLQNNTRNIVLSLNNIAACCEKLNLMEKALFYQLRAVVITEQMNDAELQALSHFNLATIYSKTGNQNKALVYFNLANDSYLSLLQKDTASYTSRLGKTEVDYAIGNLHLQSNDFETASFYFEKALKEKYLISDKTGIAKCFAQLGNIAYLRKDYNNAFNYNMQALQMKLQINDQEGTALIFSNIAKIRMKEGRIDEALLFINKSMPIAYQIDAFVILKENYLMQTSIYKTMKKHELALESSMLYANILDTLYRIQGQRAVQEMSVKYETDKTEQQNKLLLQENTIKEITIQKQKTTTLYLLGIAILILLIVIIVYIQLQSKKKANIAIQKKNDLLHQQNEKIEHQKFEIQNKNRELTDSIHYAKRIQDSMLVHPEGILQKLADYFILFRPKDIVSGDFYWVAEKNDTIIVAAIDCTGHGVPGAFMSMLGDAYLHQIVYTHSITAPDEILNHLSRYIREALSQKATNNQDGMDMVVCSIHKKSKQMDFACAKNPLIYIKNNELVKVKGDNLPVGGDAYEIVPFTRHSILLDSPVCVYIFSDGYQDQFGGQNNKKFMQKRMQELMVQHYEKPMAEQKQIFEQEYDAWKGDNEQIDDVVLFGFKL
ncbi:MAG: SpoIIE family protein phosphatase [Bacteroidales bacterium]|nr:SpoIIE family protein phosphatase [Bacteroidales bacterium]